jgi:glycosyltransferase involved in cell wall biosynthesis
VKCYPPGDAEALSRSLQELLDDPGAPEAAREAAEVRYNWDHEKEKFLGLVRSVEEKKNK